MFGSGKVGSAYASVKNHTSAGWNNIKRINTFEKRLHLYDLFFATFYTIGVFIMISSGWFRVDERNSTFIDGCIFEKGTVISPMNSKTCHGDFFRDIDDDWKTVWNLCFGILILCLITWLILGFQSYWILDDRPSKCLHYMNALITFIQIFLIGFVWLHFYIKDDKLDRPSSSRTGIQYDMGFSFFFLIFRFLLFVVLYKRQQ